VRKKNNDLRHWLVDKNCRKVESRLLIHFLSFPIDDNHEGDNNDES
jgi:hypothetical protein